MHFREREIGYLILENCDYLTEHQFLFETLRTFVTAIEALYGKLILRKRRSSCHSSIFTIRLPDFITVWLTKN